MLGRENTLKKRLRLASQEVLQLLDLGLGAPSRGIAIIVVLTVVVILTAAVVDFQYNARVNMQIAANHRDTLKAHYLARTSMALAMLVMSSQKFIDRFPMAKKFNFQLWQWVEYIIPAFQSSGGDIMGIPLSTDPDNEGSGIGNFEGSFDLQIVDEDRRINVNKLRHTTTVDPLKDVTTMQLWNLFLPAQYDKLFESKDEEGQFTDRLQLIRNIKDWVDADDKMDGMASGEEDTRYTSLKDPYYSKNAPMDSLEEMYMIQGVTDDLMAAFGESLTVWSSQKLNVSTADALTLKAIICAYRQEESEPLCDPFNPMALDELVNYIISYRMIQPIANVNTFIELVETNPDVPVHVDLRNADATRDLDVTSKVFRITATGSVRKVTRKITIIIDTGAGMRILYFRIH